MPKLDAVPKECTLRMFGKAATVQTIIDWLFDVKPSSTEVHLPVNDRYRFHNDTSNALLDAFVKRLLS